MRLMRDKRMLAVPVLLMIALSILGLAYAHWQDLIKINGIVNTGTLNVAFVEAIGIDKETYYQLFPDKAPPGWEYKDVGIGDAWLDRFVKDPHTNKTGYKKLWINITNGYPSYWFNTTFIIKNIGTVPAVFKNFTFYGHPPLVFVSTGPNMWEAIDKKLGKVVFNIELVNLVNIQLEPCHKTKAELDIHIKQSAPECHTYSFHVEIGVENWDP